MIFTKEPANKVFVFVTAYRGHESQEVNEKMLVDALLEYLKQRPTGSATTWPRWPRPIAHAR